MVQLNGVTSPFFDNYSYAPEQDLLQDLIDESITIYGQDVLYVRRNLTNLDQLYLTDDQSTYTDVFQICMYLDTYEQWQGDGNLATKFGLKINDKVLWSVSKRVFQDVVGKPNKMIRPQEGDLIYYPIAKRAFQITYVDNFEMFYQLGKLQTWKMTTELFEYSDETFNTGVPEIDTLQTNYSTNVLDYSLEAEDGSYILAETGDYIVVDKFDMNKIDPIADNDQITTENNNYLDLSRINPFSSDFKEAP
jgi:hypothetical protein